MLNKRSLTISVLLLSLLIKTTFSQCLLNVELTNTGNFKYEKIYLFSYNGANRNIIDSTSFDSLKTAKIKIENIKHPGIYEIRLSGFDFFLVSINPDDKELNIKIDVSNLKKGIWPYINKENEIFKEYYKTFNNLKFQNLAMIKMRNNKAQKDSGLMDNIKLYIAKSNNLRKTTREKLDSIENANPNSQTIKMLKTILLEPLIPATENITQNDSDLRFMQQHFFDEWDFRNPSILNNPFANERLMFYLSKFSGISADDKNKSIDIIMTKSAVNSHNRELLFEFLLQYFIKFGPTESAIYLFDKYSEGCETVNIKSSDIKIISEMRNISVGSIIPDFELNDINGNIIKLSEQYKKNKITLLLFWASSCSHCKEEIPQITKIYNKFKDKGFKVIAYSLDIDENSWKNSCQTLTKDFINITDFKGYKSEILKKYFIYRTPSSYLIDNSGRILLKNPSMYELEKFMEKL